MKTQNEIKDEVAIMHGYKDWYDLFLNHGEHYNHNWFTEIENEAIGIYASQMILANEEKWKGILQELKNDLLMFKDKCNHQQKIGLDIAIEQTDRYKNGKLR